MADYLCWLVLYSKSRISSVQFSCLETPLQKEPLIPRYLSSFSQPALRAVIVGELRNLLQVRGKELSNYCGFCQISVNKVSYVCVSVLQGLVSSPCARGTPLYSVYFWSTPRGIHFSPSLSNSLSHTRILWHTFLLSFSCSYIWFSLTFLLSWFHKFPCALRHTYPNPAPAASAHLRSFHNLICIREVVFQEVSLKPL